VLQTGGASAQFQHLLQETSAWLVGWLLQQQPRHHQQQNEGQIGRARHVTVSCWPHTGREPPLVG
jgi:hypothetical protein